MIGNSYDRYKGGNRDYCNQIFAIFETKSKFIIVFVGLVLGKVVFDGFTGPRRKIDVRYEFDFKAISKDLVANRDSFCHFD